MMSELKPCPFCGSEVELEKKPLWYENGRGYKDCYEFVIRCKKCGCRVDQPKNDSVYRSEEKARENAIEAWNRRVRMSIEALKRETSDGAISRQAAIDAICKCGCGKYCGIPCAEANAIMQLPSVQSEPKWIPCSEKLPEQYGNYLVSIEGEEPDIGTINPNNPRGWSLCDANGFYWASDKMLNVTAWMSLPKPYEGK